MRDVGDDAVHGDFAAPILSDLAAAIKGDYNVADPDNLLEIA
jgi:hypothetical protein